MAMNQKKKHTTIEDVAEESGVSTATVSRYINGTGPVAEHTAQRIQRAIDALNYVPDVSARSLAGGRTDTLGLILPEISRDFFVPLLRGVEMVAHNNAYDLLVRTTGGRADLPERVRRPLGERNVDGLLIFAHSVDTAELTRLVDAQTPLVLISREPPDELSHLPHVTIDNQGGAYKIVSHLIDICGRRRIAFLTGASGFDDAIERETGYRQALNVHNIPFDSTLVGSGEFSQHVAYQTVTQWLANGVQFDAIFAADDESALGARQALIEGQCHIPMDVALVGFDDIALSRHLSPSLTTVQVPIEEMGIVAAEMLIELVQTGACKTSRVNLATKLIVRASCGYSLCR